MDRASRSVSLLSLARKRARNAGYYQMIVSAMMIPTILIWMVLPAFTEVRVVMLGKSKEPIDSSYGEIRGLFYPSLLLAYFTGLVYFSIRIVNVTEKCKPGELEEQIEDGFNCLTIQQVAIQWEKIFFCCYTVLAVVSFSSILESHEFIFLWIGLGLSIYARIQLINRICDFIIALGKSAE